MDVKAFLLVSLGENTRVVNFYSQESGQQTERDVVMGAVRIAFIDEVLHGQEMLLQLKSEEWNGVFLDVASDQEIADKSVMKAVVKPLDSMKKVRQVDINKF